MNGMNNYKPYGYGVYRAPTGMTTPQNALTSTHSPQQPAVTPMGTSAGTCRQTQLTGVDYTQGYLRTQIGRQVKIEFLIGTNMLIDREGTLVDVGVDYLIIRETATDDLLLCDMYSIKFVEFFL